MKLLKLLDPIDALMAKLPDWVLSLFARIMIFHVFWSSVQTKISGLTIGGQHFAFWSVTDSAFFQIMALDDFPFPVEFSTYGAAYGEFFLSILIILGLFTRYAAFGLVIMTLVIQLFAYPSGWWSAHAFWMFMLLYLVKEGGGKLSLDYFIRTRS